MTRRLLLFLGAMIPARAAIVSGEFQAETPVRVEPTRLLLPAHAYAVAFYRNGLRQCPGVDYVYLSGEITTITPVDDDETLLVDYKV